MAVDNIAHGLITNGINLRENRTSFILYEIEDDPTLDDFNHFLSGFTDYINKFEGNIEINGVREHRNKDLITVLVILFKTSSSTLGSSPTGGGGRLTSTIPAALLKSSQCI